MQSRKHSFLEACLGTAIGYLIALLGQALIFPLFGIHTSMQEDMLIAGLFTGLSLARSYFVRRFFNFLHVKGIL